MYGHEPDEDDSGATIPNSHSPDFYINQLAHQRAPDQIPPHNPEPMVSLSDNGNSAKVCSRHFPIPFCAHTSLRGKFPVYRRRDTGNTIVKQEAGRQVVYDNQWVVTMNLYLSAKYNAHINLVKCATCVKVCRYLYLYIHKGGERADLSLSPAENPDEIKAYIDSKYICPNEAHFRLNSEKMYYSSHAVFDLVVHLPGRHMIFFRDNNQIRARMHSANTHLTAWFELNRQSAAFDDEDWVQHGEFLRTHAYTDGEGAARTRTFKLFKDSRQYYYFEIPEHFVYERITGGHDFWRSPLRERDTIGKIHKVTCKLITSEKYFLRLLLLTVKGATSFDDLKRVPGLNDDLPFATFKESCAARGLLVDDHMHDRCLEEASLRASPSELRYLFISILSLGEVRDPENLYLKYRDFLLDDFLHVVGSQHLELAEVRLKWALQKLSLEFGFEFREFAWSGIRPDDVPPNLDAQVDLSALRVQGDLDYARLNAEQKAAVDAIELSVYAERPSHNCFFIEGQAGTGKTFIYQTLHNRLVGNGKQVLCVAYSGIAASLLPKGQTAHSAFKLKLDMVPDERNASLQRMHRKDADKLRALDVIIWDEFTMVPKWTLDAVDQLFRDLSGRRDVAFGGVRIVAGGDFRQTLPIVKNASRSDTVCATVRFYEHWHLFKVFSLTVNVRSIDAAFSENLLDIGEGRLGQFTDEPNGHTEVPIDERFKFPVNYNAASGVNLNEFIEEFYPADALQIADANAIGTMISSRAILAPTNYLVDEINSMILRKMGGEEKLFRSYDSIYHDGALHSDFSVEQLWSQNPPGYPPSALRLKKGAIVMLLRNLSISTGLTNGTRLIVDHLGGNVIVCRRIKSIRGLDDLVYIPRISFLLSAEETGLEFAIKRVQFPLRLSFAMTINKSQGQTFERVGIYLQTPVFSHGQLYVAFSRAKDPNYVRVYKRSRIEERNCDNSVRNVVWPEALS